MDIGLARPSDRDGICALWQQVFGDSREAVEQFFRFFPHCRSYVIWEHGQIVSMLHALPQTLSPDLPAAYLYAVATSPEYRSRGLCRQLMAWAQEDLRRQGVRLTVLTPATPALFPFYGSMGYAPIFTRGHSAFSGGTPVSPEEYLILREHILRDTPHMVCDLPTLRYAQGLYGLTFYQTADGCAAAFRQDALEVLPQDLGGSPSAMALWLSEPLPLSGVFPGYALD